MVIAQAGQVLVVGAAAGSGFWSFEAARTSRKTASATMMKVTTELTNTP
jgi:hypothetical protein